MSMAVAVAAGVALALTVLAQATLLSHAITGAFQRGEGLHELSGTLAALAGVVVLRAGLSWLAEAAGHRNAALVVSSLRMRVLGALVERGPLALAGERTGELATTATQGLDALDGYFARFLPQLVLAGLVPPLAIGWVAHTDLLSGVILAVTVPLVPIFMILVGLVAQQRTERQADALAGLAAHFLHVVQGLTTLRVFGRSLAQVERIADVTDRYRRTTMATLRVAFLSALVLETLASLGTALLAVEIGVRLVDGGIGLEAGLTALILAPEVYLPLRQVGALYHACMDGLTAAGRALDVTAGFEPAAGAGAGGVTGPAWRGRAASAAPATIRFEGVGYTYPQRDRPALRSLDLEIRPGETVAVVGPSGAGKSTLAALLLRFADPDAGRITVDGAGLGELPVDAWRRTVAWVPQRPHLVTGTVADNIRLGAPEATLDAVRDAAGEAGAAEFIEALPEGYDTRLGENGLDLSAGQRQRIALARALVTHAPLLVLDEPMSHLDAGSRAAVAAAIERAGRQRSVLLIGHERDVEAHAGRVVRLAAPSGGRRAAEPASPGSRHGESPS
jgi:thiol reductant ABC exporter CydD subunit